MPITTGPCVCFVFSRTTRPPPICVWPGACRTGPGVIRQSPAWRHGKTSASAVAERQWACCQGRSTCAQGRCVQNPVCGSFVSPRPWKTGWEAGERRAARRAGGRKTGTARSVLYLMMQRTLAAAAPASAGDGGGGGADAAEAVASAERRAGPPCHQERRGQPGKAIGHRGRSDRAPINLFDTSVSQNPGAL